MRRLLLLVAGTFALLPLLASCASDAGSEASTGTTLPPEAEELVGRWAHFDVVAYEDGLMQTSIISFGFNDFSIVDGQLVDQASFCFSEQRTNQPIETSFSDAATRRSAPEHAVEARSSTASSPSTGRPPPPRWGSGSPNRPTTRSPPIRPIPASSTTTVTASRE